MQFSHLEKHRDSSTSYRPPNYSPTKFALIVEKVFLLVGNLWPSAPTRVLRKTSKQRVLLGQEVTTMNLLQKKYMKETNPYG